MVCRWRKAITLCMSSGKLSAASFFMITRSAGFHSLVTEIEISGDHLVALSGYHHIRVCSFPLRQRFNLFGQRAVWESSAGWRASRSRARCTQSRSSWFRKAFPGNPRHRPSSANGTAHVSVSSNENDGQGRLLESNCSCKSKPLMSGSRASRMMQPA